MKKYHFIKLNEFMFNFLFKMDYYMIILYIYKYIKLY